MKIEINGKEYTVEIRETPEEQAEGLKHIHYLPDDEGMLFIYSVDEPRTFWMKDTNIPLDIISITEDLVVRDIIQGVPEDETPLTVKGVYVLELNAESGVKVGDEVIFKDDDNVYKGKKNKMLVLDENGNIQMELEGGERIFSRKDTRVLIRLANKAYKTKDVSDYKKLGKKLFQFLDVQESNSPQFVKLKENDNGKNNS